MTAPSLEILACDMTHLGLLCLRRRTTITEPAESVTEVTLDHEFLMSSLHTNSERALAEISLSMLTGDAMTVLIGGLGLGYTAQAALASKRVAHVELVELLPQVIGWLRKGLIHLAAELNAEPRLSIVAGDIYARLATQDFGPRYDLILIDVDHSPQERLGEASDAFYSAESLARTLGHLKPGGRLAVWSSAHDAPMIDTMHRIFAEVSVHPITYRNSHVNQSFTDYVIIGKRGDDSRTAIADQTADSAQIEFNEAAES
jgi:spermidine synthase